MALTDEERKLLAELEQTFRTEDPGLADKLSAPPRRVHPTKAIAGVLGVIVGLLALVIGMSTHWYISVAGFLVMLASVMVLIAAWVPRPRGAPKAVPEAKPAARFMDKLEERWQNRQQG